VNRLGRQLCLGLAHAHDHHFVHREFKPENITVVDEGEGEVPKIVDFGLTISAAPDADAARLTSNGVAVGTPIYAAPERYATVRSTTARICSRAA
jgi:eukaryotic-like serine/threonine-protein kinase